jgi:hypothetical protein
MKILVHGLQYPDILSDSIVPSYFVDVISDARVTESGTLELTTEVDGWEEDALRKNDIGGSPRKSGAASRCGGDRIFDLNRAEWKRTGRSFPFADCLRSVVLSRVALPRVILSAHFALSVSAPTYSPTF